MANGSEDTRANGVATNSEAATQSPLEGTEREEGDIHDEEAAASHIHHFFQLTVKLPHPPHRMQIMVSTSEQVQDIRQSVIELPDTFQYTCFHLEHDGIRISDFVELSDVPGITPESELILVEDPYTEKDARLHLLRVRDLVGSAGPRVDLTNGINAGLCLFDGIEAEGNDSKAKSSTEGSHPMSNYDFDAPASLEKFLPKLPETPAPKCVKSISLSPWNPPPHHLRQKGHLIYIQVTTLEGEQFHITSHVSGFYTNKSNSNKFDPSPRVATKDFFAHSLISLLGLISPSFTKEFRALHEWNTRKEPLVTFALTNAIPAAPWLVPGPETKYYSRLPDPARPQETYLIAGTENVDSLRDFNEEFQSTRELPRETVQERVFRERLLSKMFADYTDAAVRGVVLITKGEVAPLNPTEGREAQIYVYNNIFFSHGADGVGTFASEGGDEAARVATGKDVMGVKYVNGLDIPGLSTPGTVVVDYLGRRLVAQSIVPGIFRPREEGQSQIDYGGVEGKDVVATAEPFIPLFEKMSQAMRVKKHDVWDKNGKKHELVASVETKGLLGTDGRKYVLDLYRTTPLDVDFLEKYWKGVGGEGSEEGYPHRMAVLRPELVESFWKSKMREHISAEMEKNKIAKEETLKKADGREEGGDGDGGTNTDITGTEDDESAEKKPEELENSVDISTFEFALNPDVFSGQQPETGEEKAQMEKDEKDVRDACDYLMTEVIPRLVNNPNIISKIGQIADCKLGKISDLTEGEVGSPMDGYSLTRLLHKRGINVRYLGTIASLAVAEGDKLGSIKTLAIQEMISRACKHILNAMLRGLPGPLVSFCVSHFLNCLLGAEHNPDPKVIPDEGLWELYHDADFGFEKLTISSLQARIEKEVQRRYRFTLESGWVGGIKHLQMLREVALKMGLQLRIKNYQFGPEHSPEPKANEESPAINGHSKGKSNGKKKSPAGSVHQASPSKRLSTTFGPDDVMNIVPIVKDSSAKSLLAEEALEAGRMSLIQDHKDMGQELLLESLSLHEQIYGVLHPEVARVYNTLSMLYYQLEEKTAAVELARKAVIVSERTLGIDSAETLLNYLNLGLFEHANGNTRTALAYIKHALGFWKIIYGPAHPDSVTTMNNVAVMLQALRHYNDSRKWFEASLAVCESIFGKSSPHTATLYFQLAQALALDHDSKGAVHRMRDAYNVFHAHLGPGDRNTKEAEGWLEQLTHNAVHLAKQAKDMQERRKRGLQMTPHVTMSTRPQPQAGQGSVAHGIAESTTSSSGLRDMDSRSIDELIRFIEGSTNEAAPKKKPTTRANPKRRGGSAGSKN